MKSDGRISDNVRGRFDLPSKTCRCDDDGDATFAAAFAAAATARFALPFMGFPLLGTSVFV